MYGHMKALICLVAVGFLQVWWKEKHEDIVKNKKNWQKIFSSLCLVHTANSNDVLFPLVGCVWFYFSFNCWPFVSHKIMFRHLWLL